MSNLEYLQPSHELVIRELANRHLYDYSKLVYPEFFRNDYKHLQTICDTLQALYEGKLLKPNGTPYKKLIMNLPPRFGKSFTLTNFTEWVLGKSNSNKIITVSYNEILSGRFSKKVRDSIEATKVDDRVIFSDIFPNTKIKKGDASASLWSLEGSHFNYLGASFSGTITGIGCNIGIIDDPIKSREEAFNERLLEQHYQFYTDTFLSRLEEGSVQIVNMTRWAERDLCGRLINEQPDDWYVIKMEAMNDMGEMLCEGIMSRQTYEDKKAITSPEIFEANYHQIAVDIKGRMYNSFKTYNGEPPQGLRKNYTDTADTGSDYLCSICYNETIEDEQRVAYVTDIIYTQLPMEHTEVSVAQMLLKNKTTQAKVESNNGGRGFARNVQRNVQGSFCKVEWFSQNKNKNARIFAASHDVESRVYFPDDWQTRFPEFYKALSNYKREGKNLHDDAPDTITGVVEQLSKPISQYL